MDARTYSVVSEPAAALVNDLSCYLYFISFSRLLLMHFTYSLHLVLTVPLWSIMSRSFLLHDSESSKLSSVISFPQCFTLISKVRSLIVCAGENMSDCVDASPFIVSNLICTP